MEYYNRICYNCKEKKNVNEYYKDNSTKDGRKYICIACFKIKRKNFYNKIKSVVNQHRV